MKLFVISLLIALGLFDPLAPAEPPTVDMQGLRHPAIIENREPVSRARDFITLDAELQDKLFDTCDELGIDPAVALALIQTESNFEPDVVSVSGCYGLCQLNPYYFPSGLSPAENIEWGMRYLAQNIEKYGDYPAALCAYNNGHDNGDRDYATVVLSRAGEWRARLEAR